MVHGVHYEKSLPSSLAIFLLLTYTQVMVHVRANTLIIRGTTTVRGNDHFFLFEGSSIPLGRLPSTRKKQDTRYICEGEQAPMTKSK
jgi:hypothetical protein